MNDLTPNDLSHLSEAEFQALCPQGEHAPGPEPLSPAARMVLDAAHGNYVGGPAGMAAAALRAAADQVVPEAANAVGDQHDEARLDQWLRIRWRILAIAAELDAQ